MSIAASDGDGDMIPHDLGCNHGHRFTLGRVHLAFEKTPGKDCTSNTLRAYVSAKIRSMSNNQEKQEI